VSHIEILASHVSEEIDPHIPSAKQAEELAVRKATAIANTIGEGVVVGADTMVVLGDVTLNKPRDAADAKRMLALLSGKTHSVFTGVAIVDRKNAMRQSFVEQTSVTFRDLSASEIEAYVASGSPLDKAGAYGIQEDFGAVFVRRIEGDYYNVVGLPICRLYSELRLLAPDLFIS
jgi:septum formation protein